MCLFAIAIMVSLVVVMVTMTMAVRVGKGGMTAVYIYMLGENHISKNYVSP